MSLAKWNCSKCTFENDWKVSKCEMCNNVNEQNTWIIVPKSPTIINDEIGMILSDLRSMADGLFKNKEINVVNSGIYLLNIVSSYESMVDKNKKYGYVPFGIYCRNFGECFTIIKAKSFKNLSNIDNESFSRKIKICQNAEINNKFKSIYNNVDNIRIYTNKVAHCVGDGIDAKKRFLTFEEQNKILYYVYDIAKVLHSWKCGNKLNNKLNNKFNNKFNKYNINYNNDQNFNNNNNNNSRKPKPFKNGSRNCGLNNFYH